MDSCGAFRTLARVAAIALCLAGCDGDDDVVFSALACNDSACDPACASLLQHPPDPARSSCSPPGPICDYDLKGKTWEYNCDANLHIQCIGPDCPTPDLGAAD